MKALRWLALLFCSLSIVQAGQIEVTPLKLELTAEHRIQSLRLRNLSPEATVVTIKPYHWTQKENEDEYELARDLIVTPPIVRLEGNSTQVVRVGLRGIPKQTSEKPYRLYIQEVVDQTDANSSQLSVALRLGVPLFVRSEAASEAHLVWEMSTVDEGTKVKATNRGGRHVSIHNLTLKSQKNPEIEVKQKVFQYILPGASHEWLINTAQESFLQGSKWGINVDTHLGNAESSSEVS